MDLAVTPAHIRWFLNPGLWYQSKTIREPKYVSCYDAQLCPVIAKGQRAPNAQLTHQIADRHHEALSPAVRTLKPIRIWSNR